MKIKNIILFFLFYLLINSIFNNATIGIQNSLFAYSSSLYTKKLFKKANYYVSKKQYRKARYYLKKLLKIHKNNPYYLFNYGFILYLEGQYKLAYKYFIKSYNYSKRNSKIKGLSLKYILKASKVLAFKYFNNSQYQKAIFWAKKYLKNISQIKANHPNLISTITTPNDIDNIKLLLGISYHNIDEPNTAYNYFSELIQSENNFVRKTANKYIKLYQTPTSSFSSSYSYSQKTQFAAHGYMDFSLGYNSNVYFTSSTLYTSEGSLIGEIVGNNYYTNNIFTVGISYYYNEPFSYQTERFLSAFPFVSVYYPFYKFFIYIKPYAYYSNLNFSNYLYGYGSNAELGYTYKNFTIKITTSYLNKTAFDDTYSYLTSYYLYTGFALIYWNQKFSFEIGGGNTKDTSSYYTTTDGINVPIGYDGNYLYSSISYYTKILNSNLYISKTNKTYSDNILVNNIQRIDETFFVALRLLFKDLNSKYIWYILEADYTTNSSTFDATTGVDQNWDQWVIKAGFEIKY